MELNIGGEGGIRTRVGVISPQTAFEAAPLRPLRYLSEKQQRRIGQPGRQRASRVYDLILFNRKNSFSNLLQSSSRIPAMTSTR